NTGPTLAIVVLRPRRPDAWALLLGLPDNSAHAVTHGATLPNRDEDVSVGCRVSVPAVVRIRRIRESVGSDTRRGNTVWVFSGVETLWPKLGGLVVAAIGRFDVPIELERRDLANCQSRGESKVQPHASRGVWRNLWRSKQS